MPLQLSNSQLHAAKRLSAMIGLQKPFNKPVLNDATTVGCAYTIALLKSSNSPTQVDLLLAFNAKLSIVK